MFNELVKKTKVFYLSDLVGTKLSIVNLIDPESGSEIVLAVEIDTGFIYMLRYIKRNKEPS